MKILCPMQMRFFEKIHMWASRAALDEARGRQRPQYYAVVTRKKQEAFFEVRTCYFVYTQKFVHAANCIVLFEIIASYSDKLLVI